MSRVVLSVGLLLALLPFPLRADGLADVRVALDRLAPTETVRARVSVSRSETEKEKPKGPARKGEATVEHGPEGLSIHLGPSVLPKPGTKAERKRHEEATVHVDPGDALKLLDPAVELRQMLDGATLVADRVEPFEGKPSRTVVFRVVPDVDEEDRKALKRYDDVVTLRLDADGLPITLERTLDMKFSKLLISFTVSQRESRRFARVGDRLVTASASEESKGSGLGQSSGSSTRWTVTPI